MSSLSVKRSSLKRPSTPSAHQILYYHWMRIRNDLVESAGWTSERFSSEITRENDRRNRLGIPFSSQPVSGMARDISKIFKKIHKDYVKETSK